MLLRTFSLKGKGINLKPGDLVEEYPDRNFVFKRSGAEILFTDDENVEARILHISASKDSSSEKILEVITGYPVTQVEERRSCVVYRLIEISFPETRLLRDWINRPVVRNSELKKYIIQGSFSGVCIEILPSTKEIMKKGILKNLYVILSTHCSLDILTETLDNIISEKILLESEEVGNLEKVLCEVNKEIPEIEGSLNDGFNIEVKNPRDGVENHFPC